MTINELKRTTEWQKLTDKEQAFLLEYIANGFDAAAAASKTFDTGSPKSAAVYARRVLDRPRVTTALEKWGGAHQIDDHTIYRNLRAAMEQDSSVGAKVAAIRLACELKGKLRRQEPAQEQSQQVPAQLVDLLADRLGEMPVGRIMSALGIDRMEFEAEDGQKQIENKHESDTQAPEQPEGSA